MSATSVSDVNDVSTTTTLSKVDEAILANECALLRQYRFTCPFFLAVLDPN